MVIFTARRSKAELVVPARLTPQEVKQLSDVDNQPGLCGYPSLVQFFRCRRAPEGGPPASSLKAALAEALVHYYPVAGRLRELPGGKKLAVDCTAEGAVFVEAHADVRLEELGVPLVPPYPCVDQFMCDVGDVKDVISKPLLAAPRSRIPARLAPSATAFELITAAAWRCRVVAIEHAPAQRVRLMFTSNARGRWKRDRPLPPGFYGNALFVATAEAAVAELLPLARAVELVREAKLRVSSDQHVRTALDQLGRGEYGDMELQDPHRTFMVSDLTRCGDDSLDLGWVGRVAGGVPMAAAEDIIARVGSFYTSCKDTNGEQCVVVPMCLPEPAMARFAFRSPR